MNLHAQMRKLKHRQVKKLFRITQLTCGGLGFKESLTLKVEFLINMMDCF